MAPTARWILGLMVMFAGMGLMGSAGFMPGLIALIGGLVIVPPTGQFIARAIPALGETRRAFGWGAALLLVGVVWAGANVQPDREPPPAPPPEKAVKSSAGAEIASMPEPQPVADVSSKIDPSAAFLIEGGGWDRTREAWGAEWIRRINAAMPKAALKVARSDECDYVEMVGLSDSRSIPRQSFSFYADCRNGKRFYVTEDELKSEAAAVSNNAKTAAIGDTQAISACEDSVKMQLHYPSTLDRHMFSTSVYRAPQGNVAVDFDFDAKNGLGAELPHHARCIIDDRGIHPAEISTR
ncbi:hypothetical protein [Emcibacter sp. SYSU 3D8]|uniref:hypothetical protein n=1 Tax=Emcibacter sp. SYSU 3D8 TaxID=3133969 RepID=UPI0031FF2D7C